MFESCLQTPADAEPSNHRYDLFAIASPGLERGCLASCNPSRDDAFGDVAARQVKVSKARAKLAGRVQAANGVAAGIDDLLPGIVDRPALRIGDCRPDLAEDERRLVDAGHCTRRPAEIRVVA